MCLTQCAGPTVPSHPLLPHHLLDVRLGSAKPLFCDAVELPVIEATAALGAYTRRGERRDAFDGMSVYTLQDGHGVLSYAENISPLASKLSFHVKLDHTGSRNARPSRGELKSTDVVTPMHGQLLQVLNVAHRGGGGTRCAVQCNTPDSSALQKPTTQTRRIATCTRPSH